jgi:RHS repeat-associated protein
LFDLYFGNISHATYQMYTPTPMGNEVMRYDYKYDQLNRIMGMDSRSLENTAEPDDAPMPGDWSASMGGDYSERYSYDANGNIQTLKRFARKADGFSALMDDLEYKYDFLGDDKKNKLRRVRDLATNTGDFTADFESMNASQPFLYDLNGRLIEDKKENMAISWFPFDKPSRVVKSVPNAAVESYKYGYDALHHRVEKINEVSLERTAYIYDANGNIMATYATRGGDWVWQSQHLYGAERLGILQVRDQIVSEDPAASVTAVNTLMDANGYLTTDDGPRPFQVFHTFRGEKQYEITNHLGNVMVVVKEQPLTLVNNGVFQLADVVSATDYYPFGMEMPGRVYSASDYNIGFQGQEEDDELKGEGNMISYKYRLDDTRLGRFFSVDPLKMDFPWNSSYAFSENRVIDGIELEGLEVVLIGQQTNVSAVVSLTTEYGVLFSYQEGSIVGYISYGGGVTNTVSASTEMSVTFFPTMPKAEYAAGQGYSAGVGFKMPWGVSAGVNGVFSGGYVGGNVHYGPGGSLNPGYTANVGMSNTVFAPISDLKLAPGIKVTILNQGRDKLVSERKKNLQEQAKNSEKWFSLDEQLRSLDPAKGLRKVNKLRDKMRKLDVEDDALHQRNVKLTSAISKVDVEISNIKAPK